MLLKRSAIANSSVLIMAPEIHMSEVMVLVYDHTLHLQECMPHLSTPGVFRLISAAT